MEDYKVKWHMILVVLWFSYKKLKLYSVETICQWHVQHCVTSCFEVKVNNIQMVYKIEADT